MSSADEKRGVGAAIPVAAKVAIGTALVLLIAGVLLYRNVASDTEFGELVIATGPERGTYHALGVALRNVLERTELFQSVDVRSTDGSFENMRLIQEGAQADLAFVQADAAPSTNARLITSLYDEVLHILVRADADESLRSVHDLEGRRISLGASDSGTRELSRGILEHLGINPAQDRVMPPGAAVRALQAGELDAVFLLAALPSSLVYELAANGSIRFLPIGSSLSDGDEAHALELVLPGVRRQLIPRATYRSILRKAVSTVSVAAMLVARAGLDDELVREVTRTVFSYRTGDAGLASREAAVARQIREDYDPAANTLPYHPGAVAYYNRERPPFFVEYAEALSLAVTLLLGMYSVFVALRELLRRRMKNRVDAYLVEIQDLVEDMDSRDVAGLRTLASELDTLRRNAVLDLVEERLLADDAYRIMQGHIQDEQALVAAAIARREAADSEGV